MDRNNTIKFDSKPGMGILSEICWLGLPNAIMTQLWVRDSLYFPYVATFKIVVCIHTFLPVVAWYKVWVDRLKMWPYSTGGQSVILSTISLSFQSLYGSASSDRQIKCAFSVYLFFTIGSRVCIYWLIALKHTCNKDAVFSLVHKYM